MNIGRKISRIRELRGMKKAAVAIEPGIAQQNMLKLENGEETEEKLPEKAAINRKK